MELLIKGKNMVVPEAVRSYAQRKIGKLDRHLPHITQAEVVFFKERTRSQGEQQVVQVTINSNGTILRGEERAVDLFAAIDAVAGVMERRIERYKGRLYERGKNASPDEIPASFEFEGNAEEDRPGRVVKVKRFAMKPMSEEEAVEQMELLDHDFFFFFNADRGQFNVLYRRRDGDYGLIEPELT